MKKFTKTHEYVEVKDSIAYIGISDHAQDALGDITYVEFPSIGSKIKKGVSCAVVESVKAASDIYSPISGQIEEINSEVERLPEIINESPEDKGWLFTIKNFDIYELDSLMSEEEYQKFLESE